MALRLNKKFFLLCVGILCSLLAFSQEGDPVTNRVSDKDYKDPEQFDKFYKRRKMVSAWQINKLKDGALIVKLKTNKLLIDAFEKAGNKAMADQKRLETAAININMSRAFRKNYKFSKLYLIYSTYNDSLLNGKRSGIFLDSTLSIDPLITMNESFYIISESDAVYNSSIGYVPEDSARFVVELGNPTITNVPIVLKNKYGHQLKRPFPVNEGSNQFLLATTEKVQHIKIGNESIPFNVSETMDPTAKATYNYNGEQLKLMIPKYFVMEWMLSAVETLDADLEEFYKHSRMPNTDRYPEIKPFLY